MVYFISDGTNYVKIGYADDVNRRIKDLQCANPRNLEILLEIDGGYALEHALHDYFNDYRVICDNIDSCEWFIISGELRKLLEIEQREEIEHYLNTHISLKNRYGWHVCRKRENSENAVFNFKKELRKSYETNEKLKSQIENQKKTIKRLENKIEKLKGAKCADTVSLKGHMELNHLQKSNIYQIFP